MKLLALPYTFSWCNWLNSLMKRTMFIHDRRIFSMFVWKPSSYHTSFYLVLHDPSVIIPPWLYKTGLRLCTNSSNIYWRNTWVSILSSDKMHMGRGIQSALQPNTKKRTTSWSLQSVIDSSVLFTGNRRNSRSKKQAKIVTPAAEEFEVQIAFLNFICKATVQASFIDHHLTASQKL